MDLPVADVEWHRCPSHVWLCMGDSWMCLALTTELLFFSCDRHSAGSSVFVKQMTRLDNQPAFSNRAWQVLFTCSCERHIKLKCFIVIIAAAATSGAANLSYSISRATEWERNAKALWLSSLSAGVFPGGCLSSLLKFSTHRIPVLKSFIFLHLLKKIYLINKNKCT